jgi:hypothetical protein
MPKEGPSLLHRDVEIGRKCPECGHDWIDSRPVTARTERWLDSQQSKIAADPDVPCPQCMCFPAASLKKLFPGGIEKDLIPMTREACEKDIKGDKVASLIVLVGSILLFLFGLFVRIRGVSYISFFGGIIGAFWGVKHLFWGKDREKYDEALARMERMSKSELMDILIQTYWMLGHFPNPRELGALARHVYLGDKPGADWLKS